MDLPITKSKSKVDLLNLRYDELEDLYKDQPEWNSVDFWIKRLIQQGYIFPKNPREWLLTWKPEKSLVKELRKLDINSNQKLDDPGQYWQLLRTEGELQNLTQSKDATIKNNALIALKSFEASIDKYELQDQVRRNLVFQKSFLEMRDPSENLYINLDFITSLSFEGGTLEDLIEKIEQGDMEFGYEGLAATDTFNVGLFYNAHKLGREVIIEANYWDDEELKYFSPYSGISSSTLL